MKITIRNLEYEAPYDFEPSEEWDANFSMIEVDGELFLEVRTMGPKNENPSPEHVNTVRLSKQAIDLLIAQSNF